MLKQEELNLATPCAFCGSRSEFACQFSLGVLAQTGELVSCETPMCRQCSQPADCVVVDGLQNGKRRTWTESRRFCKIHQGQTELSYLPLLNESQTEAFRTLLAAEISALHPVHTPVPAASKKTIHLVMFRNGPYVAPEYASECEQRAKAYFENRKATREAGAVIWLESVELEDLSE